MATQDVAPYEPSYDETVRCLSGQLHADSHQQVGWLTAVDGGYKVRCLKCQWGTSERLIPVFKINLRPYRQPCMDCGKELIEPNVGVILFDGRS